MPVVDGAEDPLVAAASGDLLLSTVASRNRAPSLEGQPPELGFGTNEIVGITTEFTDESTFVRLFLFSDVFPGFSFDQSVGLWFQYFSIEADQVEYLTVEELHRWRQTSLQKGDIPS